MLRISVATVYEQDCSKSDGNVFESISTRSYNDKPEAATTAEFLLAELSIGSTADSETIRPTRRGERNIQNLLRIHEISAIDFF